MLVEPLAAAGPVEIIVRGVRYDSIQDYKTNADKAKSVKSQIIDLKPGEEKAIKQLQVAGYEHGMNTVMTDFTQNWDDPMPKFMLKRDELAERMRALAGDRTEPVLVIAEPKKLRVMALKDSH